MLFHRWETISHIISDTKLLWWTAVQADEDAEDVLGDEQILGNIIIKMVLKRKNYKKSPAIILLYS